MLNIYLLNPPNEEDRTPPTPRSDRFARGDCDSMIPTVIIECDDDGGGAGDKDLRNYSDGHDTRERTMD